MTDNIIIVGAPRSGTNMLRDVLTALPGFTTWPCDEINLIWKHHNREFPSDELKPEHATAEVRSYMHGQFEKIARKSGAHTVVEKTCATSMRVAFTAEAFPDAKFIFIRRDGLDVAASTISRWDAPFDLRYIARKLRYAPLGDLPYYGRQFASKRVASRRARKTGASANRKVTSWWGPKPSDFRELQERHTLDELAIVQWQRCVEASITDLESLPADQVIQISYEEFVAEPARQLEAILAFLGKEHLMDRAAVQRVSRSSVGNGRAVLGESSARRLESLGEPTLKKLGYA